MSEVINYVISNVDNKSTKKNVIKIKFGKCETLNAEDSYIANHVAESYRDSNLIALLFQCPFK